LRNQWLKLEWSKIQSKFWYFFWRIFDWNDKYCFALKLWTGNDKAIENNKNKNCECIYKFVDDQYLKKKQFWVN
jgi:hypothetical protein